MKSKQRKEQRFAFALIAVAVVIAILASMSGCVTRKRCEYKFGVCGDILPMTIDPVKYDTCYITNERMLTDTFTIPMPVFFGEATEPTVRLFRTVPRVHSSKNVRLEWLNDSTLVVSATCQAETVTVKGKDRIVPVPQYKEKTVEVKPAWHYGWQWWLLAGVIGLVFGLILRR